LLEKAHGTCMALVPTQALFLTLAVSRRATFAQPLAKHAAPADNARMFNTPKGSTRVSASTYGYIDPGKRNWHCTVG
jgi:hypothetical protein